MIFSSLLRPVLSRDRAAFARLVSVHAKGILDDLDAADLIDQRRIEAHHGQKPCGQAAANSCAAVQVTRDLMRTDPFGGGGVPGRFLDLDKDIFVVLAEDQVDLAALPRQRSATSA